MVIPYMLVAVDMGITQVFRMRLIMHLMGILFLSMMIHHRIMRSWKLMYQLILSVKIGILRLLRALEVNMLFVYLLIM